MKCLVTGGAGFIGGHLVRRLVADGHEVTVIDDLSTGSANKIPAGAMLLEEDLYEHLCSNALSTSWDFETVFHLAAVSRTPPAIEEPLRCFASNVDAPVCLMEHIRRVNPSARLVLASSNVVYAADTPYRASKRSMEHWAAAYAETYGLSTICLRFSNVYGPGFLKGDPAVFASMRDSYLERGYIEITGDGTQDREFTHVSDIVEAILLAAKSKFVGTLDVTSGQTIQIRTAAWHLLDSHDPVIRYNFETVREVPERRGDVKSIAQVQGGIGRAELGWQPNIRLEDGIRDVWTIGE